MVWATDINEWSINNSQVNFELNDCPDINLLCGQINDLDIPHQFDYVLANINRNVLLEEIPFYLPKIKPNAYLILSGFFEEDQPLIEACVIENSLQITGNSTRNDWSALVCRML